MKKLAIDVGTAFIKYGFDGTLKKIRNGFVTLEKSDFILNLCNKMNINYYEHEDRVFVIGDDGFEIARQLNQPFRRCMAEGRVNTGELDSILVLTFILKSIIEGIKDVERIGITVSSQCKDEQIDFIYQRNLLQDIVKNASIIDEGYSCALGLLEEHDLTGIGISFGAGLVNVGMIYKGICTGSFSLRKALDWVDKQSARMANLAVEKIVAVKEKMNLVEPTNLIERIIKSYIEHMIVNALFNADDVMSKELEGKEVVVGISGGIVEMVNFGNWVKGLVKKGLRKIGVKDIVIGDQFTNCRGVMKYLELHKS